MPIQITPNRSSEILMQAFRDRDVAEQNTMKNELIKYQLQKAREQEQIYKTNPTMETTPQTVQGANPEAVQGLEKFGVQTNPEFTGAQQLDTQIPIPQWKQLDNLASRIALTPGGIEEAAKLKKLSEDYKVIESSHQVVMNAMIMSGYDWTKAQQIIISQHGKGIQPMLDEVKPTMGGFEVGGKYLVHYDGKITPLPQDEGDKTDTSIRKFEQLHPELASQRGSKQYRDAFVAFTKSLSPTNYVFAGSTPAGAPVVFDPKKATFEEKPVVGGGRIQPKNEPAVAVDTAAKLGMMEQGQADIKRVRDLLIDKNGKVNRKVLLESSLSLPFSEGRDLKSYILNAVEGKLRIESGAAVPEQEVKRAGLRFVPSSLDSDTTVKQKLDRLDEYLGETAKKLDPYGRISKGNKKLSPETEKFLKDIYSGK